MANVITKNEVVKAERARSPDKIQAGDLVTVEKALELIRRNGPGKKFFNLKPFWHSFTKKNLAFKARPCYGDCCQEDGTPVGVMLVIGYTLSRVANPVRKKLIRVCPLCGSLCEEEVREEEIKKKLLNNQGENYAEGGNDTKE